MALSVQERLKLQRGPLDTWSTREKLALATAVETSGDQNWSCVSRTIRPYADANRPADWFSAKNCAQQYGKLLEAVDAPKRKKRSAGSIEKTEIETPAQIIVRKLRTEHIEILKQRNREIKAAFRRNLDLLNDLCNGDLDDRIPELLQQVEEEKAREEQKKEEHKKWLKDREERKKEWERFSRTGPHLVPIRRTSSFSDPSSDADSPLSEPLNVEVAEEVVSIKPNPMSPLLTNLLKSSAPVSSSTSSILHSAITSPIRGVSAIANLLNTSPVNQIGPLTLPPSSSSPNMKNLVSNALGTFTDDHKPVPQSPSQDLCAVASGAPTLSMLLELPPSIPGKPLPMLQPPAPPPYTDHLGPPPPYSQAAEYLQKQKAEQAAAAAAVVAQAAAVIKIEDLEPSLITPVLPIIQSDTPLKNLKIDLDDMLIPLADDLNDGSNPPDLNSIEIEPMDTEEIEIEEKRDEIMIVDDKIPDKVVEEIETIIEKEQKPEKETERDVFEFHDDNLGDAEQSLSYLKTQRLAKGEMLNKRRASELAISNELSMDKPTVTIEESPTVAPEPTVEAEKVVDIIEKVAEVTVEEPLPEVEVPVVEEPVKEVETVEIKEEEEMPLSSLIEVPKEDEPEPSSPPPIVIAEKVDDVPVVKIEDDLSLPELAEAPVTEEKTESLPRATVKGRRLTTTSIPNSPAATTEEEKEFKLWKKSVLTVLSRIMDHKAANYFLKPITDEEIPGYSDRIKKPKDLGTIKKQLEGGLIRSTHEFCRDVLLLLYNAVMFNLPDHPVHQAAVDMYNESWSLLQMLLDTKEGSKLVKRETRRQERASRGENKTEPVVKPRQKRKRE